MGLGEASILSRPYHWVCPSSRQASFAALAAATAEACGCVHDVSTVDYTNAKSKSQKGRETGTKRGIDLDNKSLSRASKSPVIDWGEDESCQYWRYPSRRRADGTKLFVGHITFAADGPAFTLPPQASYPPEFAALAEEYADAGPPPREINTRPHFAFPVASTSSGSVPSSYMACLRFSCATCTTSSAVPPRLCRPGLASVWNASYRPQDRASILATTWIADRINRTGAVMC